jgi:dipeptidyl aminopeptidase/acylaminoacyl peptidase
MVPLEQSESYYEKLQQAGVRSDFYIIEGAGHGDAMLYQQEIYDIIDNFLKGLV